LDALHSEGAVNYVFKKTSKGFEKTTVETGASNSDYIVITKGLIESDKVAMADPFKNDKKQKPTKEKQL